MAGKNLPKDNGQSGTARPEPVEVTRAPAIIKKKVITDTKIAK